MDAYSRRREAEIKDQMWIQAQMDYQLAILISKAVWGDKHFPATVNEAYPGLFPQKQITWQEQKENFKTYAAEFNRRRGGGTT